MRNQIAQIHVNLRKVKQQIPVVKVHDFVDY